MSINICMYTRLRRTTSNIYIIYMYHGLRFTRYVENVDSDQYVTMTIFQLEKEFGESQEAQEFIEELIKGAPSEITD